MKSNIQIPSLKFGSIRLLANILIASTAPPRFPLHAFPPTQLQHQALMKQRSLRLIQSFQKVRAQTTFHAFRFPEGMFHNQFETKTDRCRVTSDRADLTNQNF